MIQGQVDKWRIERRNAYNLYCAWCEKPVAITSFAPLPYDDELTEQMSESDADFYARVKKEQQEQGFWLN